VTRAPVENAGEFAQLHVTRDGQTTQVDLGRDGRAHEAVVLDIGPVLHLDDAVASKVTALLGRGLARDYIDVAAALDRYPRRRLLQLAFERDPGLRVLDVALAAQRLDQLPDGRFGRYGLDPDQVLSVRTHFRRLAARQHRRLRRPSSARRRPPHGSIRSPASRRLPGSARPSDSTARPAAAAGNSAADIAGP
jgi:hypothetical protein